MDVGSRIVIIDYKDDHNHIIEKMLDESQSYTWISDPNEALSFAYNNRNDIKMMMVNVSSDRWDGVALVKELKDRGYMDYIPVVALGESASDKLKDELYDLGIVDFLDFNVSEETSYKRLKNTVAVHMRGTKRAEYMAERDSLTGALNLSGLRRRFTEIVRMAPDAKYTLVYSDLKNFKYFNSIFGYEKGNELLIKWVEIIKKYCSEDSLICRVTADQIITVTVNRSEEDIQRLAVIILDELREQFKNQFGDYVIHRIDGCYEYNPKAGRDETFDQIIGYARQAQKSIKDKVDSGCAFYNDEMWHSKQRKIELNGHLENAIKNGEIFINLQPQYNLVSGEIIGAECLCRWKHASYGMISPAEFIPALEETGKIYELDYFVWEEACKNLRRWLDEGKRLSLAVNVSRKDIGRDDLPTVFGNLINKYGLEPDMLRIEITESVFMDDAKIFVDLIAKFAELGFSVEMDDFGSGYSSMNLLHRVNVDVLKLDMGFLRDGELSEKSGNIINSVVKMAHVLNIHVLAEGVETADQAEFLKNIGCLMVQGYYFSRPITVEAFDELIETAALASHEESFDKYQLFNIQELFDKQSAGSFIFNNCMGPAALFEYDNKNMIPIIANDELCSYIGWTRDKFDAYKDDMLKLLTEKNINIVKRAVKKAIKDGVSINTIHIAKIHKYCILRMRLVFSEKKRQMFFMEFTDITKVKRLEKKVLELQQRLIEDIDVQKKKELEIRWEKEKLQAAMNMPGFCLYEYLPDEDTMKLTVHMPNGEIHERVAEDYLTNVAKKNWVAFEDAGRYCDTIREVLSTGESRNVLVQAVYPGGEYHMTKYFFTPVIDTNGKVYRVVGRADRVSDNEE